MQTYLEFEKPIADLENKIRELRKLAKEEPDTKIIEDVKRLEQKSAGLLKNIYEKLNPWQKTQVARHADRPHFTDYTRQLIANFTPLAGDRLYAEDKAIIGGIGELRGVPLIVMGHEKGEDTQARLRHNFGMARPEGYRKAIRLMGLAERFSLPVVTLVDTAGAYPGLGAEERGQAEAIARCTDMSLSLGVPVISVVIGEGGSGGALALATADKVMMLEHSIYTVASPEACASILWRDAGKAETASTALQVNAESLLKMKVIDEIIAEPLGGAHRDRKKTIENVGDAIENALKGFHGMSPAQITKARHKKFLQMGRNLD